VKGFVEAFAEKMHQRLSSDPRFQPLAVPAIDRRPLVNPTSWDHVLTIFPFMLRRNGMPLKREETARVYKLLQQDVAGARLHWPADAATLAAQRCKLGQPVQCGVIEGTPVSALRLCVSIPLIVDALGASGRGPEAVIREALLTLDKTALLTGAIDEPQAV
jgi:hypothetical protein